MTPTLIVIAPGKITPSANNPRKHFNAAAHQELTESVRTHGVIEPILIRAIPGNPWFVEDATVHARKKVHGWHVVNRTLIDKGRYRGPNPVVHTTREEAENNCPEFELIAGERRWRAAQAAGSAVIPAMVHDVDDRTVLEIQVIENAQRADLHPMEEAEGYERLVKDHGYSVEELAAKVGKSKASVYARLKLTSLCPEAREALWKDRISASVALLIARIPHPELQQEALKDVAEDFSGEPLPYREAAHHIQYQFMTRLSGAPWKLDDAELVPAAGACKACPKRTGNQPELFADVEAKDTCTDPKCFAAKREAWAARRLAEANAKGLPVMEPAQTKKIFGYGSVKRGSGFVALNEWCDAMPGTAANHWRKALGKKCPPVVLAVDDKGDVHELVDRKQAIEALQTAGKIDAKDAAREQRGGDDQNAQEKRRAKRKKVLERVAKIATDQAIERLSKRLTVDAKHADLWMMLAHAVGDRNGIEVAGFIAARRWGVKLTEARHRVGQWLEDEMKGGHQAFEFVVESLLFASWNDGWDPKFSDRFKAACLFAGVDLKQIEKDNTAEADKPAKKKKAKKGEES